MKKIKAKVKVKVLLKDPFSDYTLDYQKVGTVINDIPDNDFWRGKIREGYLDMLGTSEDEPEKDAFGTLKQQQLKDLCELLDVDTAGCKSNQNYIDALKEKGATEEDIKLLDGIE